MLFYLLQMPKAKVKDKVIYKTEKLFKADKSI